MKLIKLLGFSNKFKKNKVSMPTQVIIENIPLTLAELKKLFLAKWESNINEFNHLFPDMSNSLEYFQGTISGSVAYVGIHKSNDLDIFLLIK